MSNGDDPTAIADGISDAQDAFEHAGLGQSTFEAGIDSDEDWTTVAVDSQGDSVSGRIIDRSVGIRCE